MDISAIVAIFAAIGSCIAALFTYLNSRRESKLKYITEERQKWREEIREIAENIEMNTINIKRELTKLKVRINAYGLSNKNDDAHIFNIIKEIEKYDKERNDEKILEKKEILIEYLSFLLKHDWERVKDEVNKDKFDLGSVVLFIIGLLLSLIMLAHKINVIITILSIIIYYLLRLFIFFGDDKHIYKKLYSCKNQSKIFLMFIGVVILIGIGIYVTASSNQISNEKVLSCFCVLFEITCLFFSLFIKSYANYKEYRRNKEYADALKEYDCLVKKYENQDHVFYL